MAKAKRETAVAMARGILRNLVDQQNRVLEAECAADADTPKGRKRLNREKSRLGALLIAAGVTTPAI